MSSSDEPDDVKADIKKLKAELDDKDDIIEERDSQISRLEKQIKNLKKGGNVSADSGGMEQLQREIATLKNDKETLSRQLQESKEMTDKKQKAITVMQEKMKNSKETEEDLNTRIAILVLDRDDTKRQLKEMYEKYENLTVVYENHKTKIDDLEDKIVNQERALRQLRRGDSNANRNLPAGNATNPPRGGKDDLNTRMAVLVVDRDDTRKQLNQMNEKYEQLNMTYNDHKQKIDELQDKIMNQERELRQWRKGDFNANRNLPAGNATNPPRGGIE